MKNTIEYYLGIYSNERDLGRFGKAFECACREYTSGRKVKRCAPQGKVDARITHTEGGKTVWAGTFEYKTACGEIECATKAQYIAYCPEISLEIPIEQQCFVFNRQQWIDFINGYPGRGSFTRVTRDGHTHIQSFYSETRPKASKPIANYIWDCCYEQPTLEEFLEELRG